MPTNCESRTSCCQDWQAICKVVNSGVVLWAFMSYPFHLQQEGGGVYFLISIVLAFVVIQPVFINELSVGQLNQKGLINVWGNMVPFMRGIGLASAVVSFYILSSCEFMCAMSGFYFVNSFQSPPPWANYSDNTGNTSNSNLTLEDLLNSVESYYKQEAFPTVTDFEDPLSLPHLHLWTGLALIYFILCLFQYISIKFVWVSSAMSSVLFCVSYIIVFCLFFGALINGATPVYPDWKISSLSTLSLLVDAEFWINILLRSFTCLPLGIGAGIKLGSLNKLSYNLYRTAIYLSLIGITTEILIGTLLYTTLNHLSQLTSISRDSFYTVGQAIVFQTIPFYLSNMEIGSQLQTILYFALLLGTSAASVLMLIQRLTFQFKEVFPALPDLIAIVVVAGLGFLLTLPRLTSHGNVYIIVAEIYGIRPVKICLVLLQLLAIYVYSPKKYFRDLEFMMKKRLNILHKIIWLIILPIMLLAALWEVWKYSNYFTYTGRPIPTWALAIGFAMAGLVILCLLVPLIYELVIIWNTSADKSVYEIGKRLFKYNDKYGPKDENDRGEWIELKEFAKWREKTENHPLNFGQWV